MSEPITLWDAHGNQVRIVAPSEAQRLVQSGELFTEPPPAAPVVPVVDVEPPAKRKPKKEYNG